jgi:hypothetical protein
MTVVGLWCQFIRRLAPFVDLDLVPLFGWGERCGRQISNYRNSCAFPTIVKNAGRRLRGGDAGIN